MQTVYNKTLCFFKPLHRDAKYNDYKEMQQNKVHVGWGYH